MSPRKRSSPFPTNFSKLKREPVPTFFTLLVDHDRPDRQPELRAVTEPSFTDCQCTCEKGVRRFDPEMYVISDGVFALSIMCSSKAATRKAVGFYERIWRLGPPTQTTSRQATLKPLIWKFAKICEHKKILSKVFERRHHFVPYPIIPRCRVDHDGVPLMESDSDLDEKDEKPDEPIILKCQSIFAYTTNINHALIERLEQKLPRNPRNGTSERPGYIYILKSSRIPKMLKIGVTTKDPAVRREQWDRCYPTIQLHAYTSLVPHARLVEDLIHTELLVQGYKEDCSTCKGSKARARSHTEWFKVTEQLAEQVVLRWGKWMGSRPYHPDDRTLAKTWVARLQKAEEKGFRPGVDHILCTEDTWQTFTDMRRPKGGRDDSGAVELTICKKRESPFLD